MLKEQLRRLRSLFRKDKAPVVGQTVRTSTQFEGAHPAGVTDAVVGLDFGTSSTKVVIRTPYIGGQRCVAIPFGDFAHPGSPYLLPTRLREQDGVFALGRGSGQSWQLKVAVMDNPTNLEAKIEAASYLALVLQEARTWFLRTQKPEYGRHELRWSLNLGIPSAGYDDDDIRNAFTAVGDAAWKVSTSHDQFGDVEVREAIRAAEKRASGSETSIEVVPEVAAAVVGYARSPLRNPGLHVMVDVGASTLDLCSFVLHDKEGEDRYGLLTALVEPLGLHALHRRRIQAIERAEGRSALSEIAQIDPLEPVPESHEFYTSDSVGKQALESVDDDHRADSRKALMSTLVALRRWRDPYSRRWTDGVPVFLSGGGAVLSMYPEILKEAEQRLNRYFETNGVVRRVLPRPESLANDDVGEEIFGRLAVAYGLSYDSLDIGEVVPPSAINDLPPREKLPDRDPISKDQV